MGFRSTFTIEHYDIHWPEWFAEKYKDIVFFTEDHKGVMAAKKEFKVYDDSFVKDIQKAIDWHGFGLSKIVLVYLHECGGITRCQIEQENIKWSEPDSWRVTEQIEHDYCYGCSDV